MSDTVEKTLSIIKPDAVQRNYIGNILSRFENAGLKIVAMRMQQLARHRQLSTVSVPYINLDARQGVAPAACTRTSRGEHARLAARKAWATG